MPRPDIDVGLVLAFARMAAHSGWFRSTLDAFCIEHNIANAERHLRWPNGVRSIAREFNAYADSLTLDSCLKGEPKLLSEILIERFHTNEPFKASVRRLAFSDLLHPVDTLARTATTAALFWRCQAGPETRPAAMHTIRIGALVLLYSAAVLVWLWDKPPAYDRLRTTIRMSTAMLGAR